jgi:hypothetical protein
MDMMERVVCIEMRLMLVDSWWCEDSEGCISCSDRISSRWLCWSEKWLQPPQLGMTHAEMLT